MTSRGHIVDVAFSKQAIIKENLFAISNEIFDIPFSRSPLSFNNIQAFKKLTEIVINGKYDFVHTHTPVASVLTRLVCKKTKTKIIYTAHGFHFYKGASLLNWLIYYPIEKWLSNYTDVLITINQEDYDFAKRRFKAKDIIKVNGVGIDLSKFDSIESVVLEDSINNLIHKNNFNIMSIGELNKNKNHRIVIKAISKLEDKNIHYYICGIGNEKKNLIKLSEKLGIAEQVHLLGFRKDVLRILYEMNLFIFPSFREGLPVSLMEAMALGIPVICSNIRGNRDLIEDGKNGFYFEPRNMDNLALKILKLMKDKKTMKEFSEFSKTRIMDFDLQRILNNMIEIYQLISNEID